MSLFFGFLLLTLFGASPTVRACGEKLVPPQTSPHARTLYDEAIEKVYRTLYESALEGLGAPVQAIGIEQPTSNRKQPKPQEIQLYRLGSGPANTGGKNPIPSLGDIRFTVFRQEGLATGIVIHGIRVHPQYVRKAGSAVGATDFHTIQRALVARVLQLNPDTKQLSLSLSRESIEAVHQELGRLVPHEEPKNFSLAFHTAQQIEEMSLTEEGRAIGERALGQASEVQLLGDLGFEYVEAMLVAPNPRATVVTVVVNFTGFRTPSQDPT